MPMPNTTTEPQPATAETSPSADTATGPATPPPGTPPTAAPAEEIGGPAGPEPTRFGDWERKGRCIDF